MIGRFLEIYDKEFSTQSKLTGSARRYTPTRCKEIRVDYEAFCGTGQYSPPNFIPPNPVITDIERQDFVSFHRSRNQLYSCVLPGELVRECVSQMDSGSLDVISLLGITHLIVDEYQDLETQLIYFLSIILLGRGLSPLLQVMTIRVFIHFGLHPQAVFNSSLVMVDFQALQVMKLFRVSDVLQIFYPLPRL